jgi:hypothetical protein
MVERDEGGALEKRRVRERIPQYPDDEKRVTILACCWTWKPCFLTSWARTWYRV